MLREGVVCVEDERTRNRSAFICVMLALGQTAQRSFCEVDIEDHGV